MKLSLRLKLEFLDLLNMEIFDFFDEFVIKSLLSKLFSSDKLFFSSSFLIVSFFFSKSSFSISVFNFGMLSFK